MFTVGALADPEPIRPLMKLTCHRLPERSFCWTPGLCARCTFFWAGMLPAAALMFFRRLPGSLIGGLFLILPLVIDGSLQFIGLYESTNLVRAVTGALAGTGICVLFESGIRTG